MIIMRLSTKKFKVIENCGVSSGNGQDTHAEATEVLVHNVYLVTT